MGRGIPPPTPPPSSSNLGQKFSRACGALSFPKRIFLFSPFEPIFFQYDSSELDEAARQIIENNVDVLRSNPTWIITVEGHCDQRGTPEYNLALGERRALAVQDHLVSLGLNPTRVRTVSYGKEFPFDPADTDDAHATNRRAHFVITGR